MIAYKVVDKRTRYGTNAAIFIDSTKFSKYEFERFIKENDLVEYYPSYEKGNIAEAVKDSHGIMCFHDINDAYDFMERENLEDICEIIKVEGINLIHDGKRSYRIAPSVGMFPNNVKDIKFYEARVYYITYEKVKVLE
jgi:hypothetical protein